MRGERQTRVCSLVRGANLVMTIPFCIVDMTRLPSTGGTSWPDCILCLTLSLPPMIDIPISPGPPPFLGESLTVGFGGTAVRQGFAPQYHSKYLGSPCCH